VLKAQKYKMKVKSYLALW